MRFVTHRDLHPPHGNAIIWRYMPLDKFLDLLTHSRLFFTNAANFSDEFDVTLPEQLISKKRREFESNGLVGRELDEAMLAFEHSHHPMRDRTLVNCWSLGRDESYALWKIYLGGSKAGVAIRTSYGRLKKAIRAGENDFPEKIYAGEVQYADFLPEEKLSRFRLVTTKRRFYEYEKEVRLFILNFPKSEGGTRTPYDLRVGRHVTVDLDHLIDEIYISPFSGSWLTDSLSRILKKTSPKISSRLTRSSIRDR